MKKIGILMMAAMCYLGAVETTTYAKSSGEERVERIEDIVDIFKDDDDDKDKKHKKHPGNSKNGKDNHGQNKKK